MQEQKNDKHILPFGYNATYTIDDGGTEKHKDAKRRAGKLEDWLVQMTRGEDENEHEGDEDDCWQESEDEAPDLYADDWQSDEDRRCFDERCVHSGVEDIAEGDCFAEYVEYFFDTYGEDLFDE